MHISPTARSFHSNSFAKMPVYYKNTKTPLMSFSRLLAASAALSRGLEMSDAKAIQFGAVGDLVGTSGCEE